MVMVAGLLMVVLAKFEVNVVDFSRGQNQPKQKMKTNMPWISGGLTKKGGQKVLSSFWFWIFPYPFAVGSGFSPQRIVSSAPLLAIGNHKMGSLWQSTGSLNFLVMSCRLSLTQSCTAEWRGQMAKPNILFAGYLVDCRRITGWAGGSWGRIAKRK